MVEEERRREVVVREGDGQGGERERENLVNWLFGWLPRSGEGR